MRMSLVVSVLVQGRSIDTIQSPFVYLIMSAFITNEYEGL